MSKTLLFEEIRDSVVRALARTKALASINGRPTTARIISYCASRGLNPEVKWFDCPDVQTEDNHQDMWLKVTVGGNDVIIYTYHIDEKILVEVEGVTDPKTPLEICYNIEGISSLWYRGITRDDLPAEVDKFLCDILEVI